VQTAQKFQKPIFTRNILSILSIYVHISDPNSAPPPPWFILNFHHIQYPNLPKTCYDEFIMNRRGLIIAILFLLPLSLPTFAAPTTAPSQVDLIDINGPIGPATAEFVSRAISLAADHRASCLIIRLDTPGGALDSTKTIIQSFDASPVPIVVYVAPSKAGATSAGCFITLAADIAAMAPATNIGAAHPVTSSGGDIQEMGKTMNEKVENYTVSLIQAIAIQHHRNAEWAKSAVLKSASITAEEAVKINVIDLIASDTTDLLKQIDGRSVRNQTLHTAGATIVQIPTSWWEKFIAVLSHPNLAYILMLIAIYGILGEINNPGAILPGVAGGIALLLLLYMFSILPVSAVGLLMIALAVTLFIVDVFAPTHGILTGGGIVAFFIGSLMLFGRGDAFYHVSMSLIIPATLVTAIFFLFVIGKGLAAQRLPVQVGHEILLGKTTTALTPITPHSGKIFIEGEYWNATSDTPIEKNNSVEIIGVNGLTLKVKETGS
jgi:membrane-bound serine protease (ClpP class)